MHDEQQTFLTVGLLGIILCSLLGAVLPRLTAKQTRSLHFLSMLIGVFLLVAFLYPWSRALQFDEDTQTLGRVVAALIFFGLLALFRLMGKFESPS